MRSSPTIAFSGNIGLSTAAQYATYTALGAYAGNSSALLQVNSGSIGGAAGGGVTLLSNNDATAFISLSAEL